MLRQREQKKKINKNISKCLYTYNIIVRKYNDEVRLNKFEVAGVGVDKLLFVVRTRNGTGQLCSNEIATRTGRADYAPLPHIIHE